MPTYITLVNYTQKGIENMKKSPERLQKARDVIQAKGGQMKYFYLTLGHYDAVAIVEAPNDGVYTEALLTISSAGAIQTETLKALTEEDYRKVVSALP